MFAMGSSVKFSTRFFILRHLPGMGCQTGSKTSKHGIAPLAKQATIAQESSNNFKLLGSYSFGTHQKSLLSSSCGWSVVPRPPYSLTCLVIIDLLFKTGKRQGSQFSQQADYVGGLDWQTYGSTRFGKLMKTCKTLTSFYVQPRKKICAVHPY